MFGSDLAEQREDLEDQTSRVLVGGIKSALVIVEQKQNLKRVLRTNVEVFRRQDTRISC